MDFMAVNQAASKALDGVRKQGPFLLEVLTYRFRGHSMGDPERYRTAEAVKRWQNEEDPLGIYHKYLVENEITSAEELDELEKSAEQEVQQAVQFAESSAEPSPDDLYKYLYVEME